MNQSTENLIYESYDQLHGNGYVNNATTIYQTLARSPSMMTYDLTTADVHQVNVATADGDTTPPNFVLGPYNQRKRLLSCIVENWPESDSFNSLPAEVSQSPRDTIDCAGVPMKKPFSWEAEDVADYITTLDEACILDIESYEEIDKLDDQQKWIAQTYGPIYEPLLKPGEDFYARPKSLCLNYDTQRRVFDADALNDTTSSMSNGQSPDEYATIAAPAATTNSEYSPQITDLDDSPDEERLLHTSSTENLILNCQSDEDFLYLNPAYNRSKCRTPLPVISLNSSFYDESTSMNSSMYDPNVMANTQMYGGDKSITNNNSIASQCHNAINPLENSVIEMDGDKALGDEQMSTMKVAAENGKWLDVFVYFSFIDLFIADKFKLLSMGQTLYIMSLAVVYAYNVFGNRAMSRSLPGSLKSEKKKMLVNFFKNKS